ncbi:MAG: hypothetical protein GEV09_08410 [Pseudonocardiaceae bacterium]|nr:hypothetical protein [Pseudonocardiaceae bacterium]
MSTAMMIILGVLVWILLAILLALFLGRMIRLRDRQGRSSVDQRLHDPTEDATSTSSGTQPDPRRNEGD